MESFMSSASSVVELRSVSKRFGERLAVDKLDLQVPSGICFGLLGPNGAGKTTTLRMIYGTTRATTGTICVFGLDISRSPRAVKSRLGVTLQQNVLIEASVTLPRESGGTKTVSSWAWIRSW